MNDVQHDVQQTFYDAVGGAETFHKLTARFYEEVAKDEVVRPLYPEADLGPAERRMRMFLEQYWGGTAHVLGGAWTPASADAPQSIRDRPDRA